MRAIVSDSECYSECYRVIVSATVGDSECYRE